jgi:hypothetical protein
VKAIRTTLRRAADDRRADILGDGEHDAAVSVQSSVFVHLHHTAAGTLHLHATASRRAACRRADRGDRIFHIDRSGMVELISDKRPEQMKDRKHHVE